MTEARARAATKPSDLHARVPREAQHLPLSLRRMEGALCDNRPAFPGDPEMDWQNDPERPHDPKWSDLF